LNIKFEIRNNKLDQLQSMSAKMAVNGIWIHAHTNQWRTLDLQLILMSTTICFLISVITSIFQKIASD